MGFQLHETMYGKRFFENQLPSLIRAINRLADVDEKRQAAEPTAVMRSNTVYVCYEENSHELAIENGAVNELYVASSLDDVRKWVDTLTLDKFLCGLATYIRSCYGFVVKNGCLDPGAIDAEGADCIVQYALFGDVIYG